MPEHLVQYDLEYFDKSMFKRRSYDSFPHQGIDEARFPDVGVPDGADGQEPLLELEAFPAEADAVVGNVDASDRLVDLLLPRILKHSTQS